MIRRTQFNFIKSLVLNANIPWLCSEDFNNILTEVEKWRGAHFKLWKVKYLKHMIDNCALIEMAFVGTLFTRFNGKRY